MQNIKMFKMISKIPAGTPGLLVKLLLNITKMRVALPVTDFLGKEFKLIGNICGLKKLFFFVITFTEMKRARGES